MKGLIFTWILTLLGVGTSFIRPYYGFLAYVALAILRPDFLWSSHIQGGRFSLIVAGAMLLNWIVRCCGNWKLGPARGIVLLFTGSWVWSVFLALQADSPQHAWYYVEQQAKILLPFLVGITTLETVRDLRILAWTIVICEGYVALEMNMWYFSGYNYLWHIGFGGVDNNSAAIGLVTALGVAFFLFLNEEAHWKKIVLAGCAAFMGHAILFSFSRGAMLATVIFAVISFFIIKKSLVHYSIFGAGLLMALILAGPQVRDRFFETFEKKNGVREASAQSRLDLWKHCGILLMRNPILGCGPDHWPLHSHEFGWPKGKEAHSLWVQTTVELGIPGIMMFMGFYVLCIWRCWLLLKRLRDSEDSWFADSARMTVAALVGFMVAAQFVSLEALEIPYYVALLGAGTLVVQGRSMYGQLFEAGLLDKDQNIEWTGTESASATQVAQSAVIEAEWRPMNVPTYREWTPSYLNAGSGNEPAEFYAGPATAVAVAEPVTQIRDWRDRIDEQAESESLIMN
jgi:probable O-glycosylation ligase (exosortase A-associated)